MTMDYLIAPITFPNVALRGLAKLLLDQGVDLMTEDDPTALRRGTPVYVHTTADPKQVERRMLEGHVRMLFIVERGAVVGVVDLADLALRAEALASSRD